LAQFRAFLGLAIVDQDRDITFLFPQLLEALERLIVNQRLGEVHRVDAARGRARQDVYNEPRSNGVVGLYLCRISYLGRSGEDLPQLTIHEPRAAEILESQRGLLLAVVGLLHSRRAHQLEELLGHPIHVDGERYTAVHHDRETHLLREVDLGRRFGFHVGPHYLDPVALSFAILARTHLSPPSIEGKHMAMNS